MGVELIATAISIEAVKDAVSSSVSKAVETSSEVIRAGTDMSVETSGKDIEIAIEEQATDSTVDAPESLIEESEITKLTCRNENLADKQHPETNVPFVTKIVQNAAGKLIEVVVPEFDSLYNVQLPENLVQASDSEQFYECNQQLKEAIQNDPELAEKFTPEQLEQIFNVETPDGFSWHHDAELGKMQLVDQSTHLKTGHTGGRNFWGGGSTKR